MKFIATIVMSAISATVIAAPTAKTEHTVPLPLVNHEPINVRASDIDKRVVTLPLEHFTGAYIANISIGNPAQSAKLLVDTGGYDTWLYDWQYEPTSSSSSELVNHHFSQPYSSQSISGDWYQDSVYIGDTRVETQHVGVSYKNNSVFPRGSVGLTLESSYGHSNIPANLKNEGLINTNGFSLFLNSTNASSGSILFGGIDKAKYSGELFDAPVTFSFVWPKGWTVEASVPGHGDSFTALLDSGTSISYIPKAVLQSVVEELGAEHDKSLGYYAFDEIPDKNLVFDFGSGKIEIPGSEYALDPSVLGVNKPTKKYVLGFTQFETHLEAPILGLTFLRSAYVVFNADEKKVSLAKASYSGGSDITEI